MRYNPTAILGALRHSLKTYNLAVDDCIYTPDINGKSFFFGFTSVFIVY